MITEKEILSWKERGKLHKLLEVLNSNDKDIRSKAEEALVSLGKDGVEPILKAFGKQKFKLRHDIGSRLLTKIYKTSRDEEIIDILISSFTDEKNNWDIRNKCALALGSTGHQRALEPLVTQLLHDSGYLNSNVVQALAALKNESAIPPLIRRMVGVYQGKEYIEDSIIEALVKLGGTSVPYLLEEAEKPGANRKEAVLRTLKKLKNKYMSSEQSEEYERLVERYGIQVYKGGLGERYCSKQCYTEAADFINGIAVKRNPSVCGICKRKITSIDYTVSGVGIVPYEGGVFYVCSNCGESAHQFFKSYNRCCMCGRLLE